MCAQRVKTGKGGRGPAGTVAKVGKVAAAAGLAPALTIAATPQPSGASVIDTKAAWTAAQWGGPVVRALDNRKCSLGASHSHSYATTTAIGSINYGIETYFYPPKTSKIKILYPSRHKSNFVDQEMWENLGSFSWKDGSITLYSGAWIEEGETAGAMPHVASLPSPHFASTLGAFYWADNRKQNGMPAYWSHFLYQNPLSSKVYSMFITPNKASQKSWNILLKQGTNQWSGTGTTENMSKGSTPQWGIENTCKSNLWPMNVQTILRRTGRGGAWVAGSSKMVLSKYGGFGGPAPTDVAIAWVKSSKGSMKGKKFSAGT